MTQNCGRTSKRNIMTISQLYKYLDFEGGLSMLKNHNLQFTNPSKLNDPFDCHPSLINFSNVPEGECKIWPANIVSLIELVPYKKTWEDAWICSLSKVNDALLMWSYYSSHNGVCIGVDISKAQKYFAYVWNGCGAGVEILEVQYKDILEKPDIFHDSDESDFYRYQLSTKAKAWEHEQEIRLLIYRPYYGGVPSDPPKPQKDENGDLDYKGLRFYPQIGKECFRSLYLGINVEKSKQDEIVSVARTLNPEMKIYKMTVDPGAFRLKPELVQ